MDGLLLKYRGREEELLTKLKAKYEIKQFVSSRSHSPEITPTLRNQKVPTSGGWGSFLSPSTPAPPPDNFHSSEDNSDDEEEEEEEEIAYTGPRLSREEMVERARRQARENMDRRIRERTMGHVK